MAEIRASPTATRLPFAAKARPDDAWNAWAVT
jgi:hypothetical protein